MTIQLVDIFGFPFELWQFPILLLTGFVAGFIDTIAGGGGIIVVPVLLSLGLPPHLALGTNKFQASFGSFTASWRYTKGGLVNPLTMKLGIFWTVVGAVLGSTAILALDPGFLQWIIPVLLVGIFFYLVLKPEASEIQTHARLSEPMFYLIMGLAIGFYDGFFGPGTGSFWTIAFIALLGLPLKQATGHTKITNFTSNLVSVVVFGLGGSVLWVLGLAMGAAQFAGAWLGSHIVIHHSTRLIRRIFLTMVALTIANIIRQNLGIWV